MKIDILVSNNISELIIVISQDIMLSIISLIENDMMTNEEYFIISKYENLSGLIYCKRIFKIDR